MSDLDKDSSETKTPNLRNNKSHRKISESSVENTLTPEAWEKCKSYFDYTCAYCGVKPKLLSKDHFIPLNQGGGLTIDNVVPCCQSCNNSKSGRKFSQWYKSAPFYSSKRELKIFDYLKSVKKPD